VAGGLSNLSRQAPPILVSEDSILFVTPIVTPILLSRHYLVDFFFLAFEIRDAISFQPFSPGENLRPSKKCWYLADFMVIQVKYWQRSSGEIGYVIGPLLNQVACEMLARA